MNKKKSKKKTKQKLTTIDDEKKMFSTKKTPRTFAIKYIIYAKKILTNNERIKKNENGKIDKAVSE